MGIAERWKGHPPLPEGLEQRLSDIVARLRRAGAELIYLFGSAAVADDEGVRRPQDLDLAVWGMREDPWRARADLEEILETDRLDLVRLEESEPELRFRVVSGGRLLHAESPELENRVELKILREYRDLAPLRRLQKRYVRARHGLDGP